MATKRDLKKQIQYVCGDLAAECLIAKNFVKGVDCEAMKTIIGEIADLQTSTLAKVSFSFDKLPKDFAEKAEYSKARTAYYRKAYASLRAKFLDHVNDIVRKMNAALPQEVKDNNIKG